MNQQEQTLQALASFIEIQKVTNENNEKRADKMEKALDKIAETLVNDEARQVEINSIDKRVSKLEQKVEDHSRDIQTNSSTTEQVNELKKEARGAWWKFIGAIVLLFCANMINDSMKGSTTDALIKQLIEKQELKK